MYKVLCLLLITLSLCCAVCTTYRVDTLPAYAALTNATSNCLIVIVSNLNISHVTLTGPIAMLSIQNCKMVEKITVTQTTLPSDMASSFYFINNPYLVDYTIMLSNTTTLSFINAPSPTTLNVSKSYVTTLTVTDSTWTTLDMFRDYSAIIGVTLSRLPNISDINILGDWPDLKAVELDTLPSVVTLPVWSKRNFTTFKLNQVPLSTLHGMEAIQYISTLNVGPMSSLYDISALAHTTVRTAQWAISLSLCCPSKATGFYDTWSIVPTCHDCFVVTAITPTQGPIAGGIPVILSYTGAIRSTSIVVRFTTAVTCDVSSTQIMCITPAVSTAGSVALTYGEAKTSLNISFTYIIWSDVVTAPHLQAEAYLQDGSEPALPEDKGEVVTLALTVTWALIGAILIGIIAIHLTCGLSPRLDCIGITEGTTVKRTSAGALILSIGMCILVGACISVVASYGINNTWGATSLITPQLADLNTDWEVALSVSPSAGGDLTFTTSMPGWQQNTPGVWSCQACTLTSATFSVRANSWTSYAYEVTWMVNTSMSGLSGRQNSTTGMLLKGGIGAVNILATPTLIRQDGHQTTGTTLRHGVITPIPTLNTSQVMTSAILGLDIHIVNTENWRLNTIYNRQSVWSILAQLAGMASGVMTIVRIALNVVERRHRSAKPLI